VHECPVPSTSPPRRVLKQQIVQSQGQRRGCQAVANLWSGSVIDEIRETVGFVAKTEQSPINLGVPMLLPSWCLRNGRM
jgi:hypothetical protein